MVEGAIWNHLQFVESKFNLIKVTKRKSDES